LAIEREANTPNSRIQVSFTRFVKIKDSICSTTNTAMTLEELEAQLLALAPPEKARVIQLLAQSLENSWRGIEKTPGVCGGDACIAETRIPVWVLVNARRLSVTETELLRDYPTLSATDLANAWVYASAYAEEIEAAIQENEAA
jgi:uncharacterized protein (DUF433 family)